LDQEDLFFVNSHHIPSHNSSPAYQLIVTDLDGTLLDSRGRITRPVADAIREATAAGIEVIVASGRNRPAVEPVLHELGLNTPHIGTGGAYLSHPDGRLLFHEPVPALYIPEIVETIRRYGLGMGFFEVEATYLEGPPNLVQWMLENYSSPGTLVVSNMLQAEIDLPGKIFVWGELPALHKALKKLKGRSLPLTLVKSLDNGFEINAIGVTKGWALKAYAELQGIPLDRVAAFGDQHNDLSMFAVAGLAVAMGNAPEAVQAAADHIAPTNDQSGLAWGIRNLVLSSENSQVGMEGGKR
jgi:Cof subfamily protein (haloacid dehalogenase superfamily)